MKRSVSARTMTCAAISLLAFLAACGREEPLVSETASNASEWQQPPSITQVRWNGSKAVLEGVAEPASRVIFAGAGGAVHAANADGEGHFDISLDVPEGGLLLKPRSQIGQTFINGFGEVYVLAAPVRVAVTLIDGDASYRIGAAGPLDAVDSDGAVLMLSGRTRKTGDVRVTLNGETYTSRPDHSGRWVLAVSGAGPARISVEGRDYDFSGAEAGESPPQMIGQGWRITRNLGGKAVQTTWLPVDM